MWPGPTRYRTVDVLGRRIFYREAGRAEDPVVLLLHGFPASSHTYRELIPLLSGRYRVIAPDHLGSGYSDHPSPSEVTYTFDLLAQHVLALMAALNIDRYALYLQDFGGPVGLRILSAHPERVSALIVQNANAYLDGLTPARREFFRNAHADQSPERTAELLERVSDRAIRDSQYLRDVPGPRSERMSPDAWTHDIAMLASQDDRMIQVQLFQDYQNNIDAYPSWQQSLRKHQPPTLVLWGERDPAFIADGARAYLRDLPLAELHLLDAGHFAAEERPVEVAQHVVRFLERTLAP
jgi:pimeloyl-ACP methyl ester carboxylesterase